MRKFCLYLLPVFVLLVFAHSVLAENIHFGDYLYKFKSEASGGTGAEKYVENQYFKDNENLNSWSSKAEVSYFPEMSNPLKFAAEADKKIENDEKCVLLKFVQNRKQNIAIITYLENGIQVDGNFFLYNICKYEKNKNKGIKVLKVSKKYLFNTNEEIAKIGKEIRAINNDYIERMIITSIPDKEIAEDKKKTPKVVSGD